MNALALALAVFLAAQDPEVDQLRQELKKLKADNAVAYRQLEVFMAQIQELNDRLAKAQNQKSPAVVVTQTAEEVKAWEEKRAQMAREKEKLKSAAQAVTTPMPVVAPARVSSPPEGKITAVAHEIDLVVISMGSEDGVVEGQTYTILRDGQTVATLKIDRVDRKWAAGKVLKKVTEPRVADSIAPEKAGLSTRDVTYHVVRGTGLLSSSEELRAIRKELDEVRSQVRQLSDRIVPSWQGAGVSVEETPEELRTHLEIVRGLLVRRVREGSPAEKAGLKANDVVPDLLETQLLQAIETGTPLQVIRQGQKVRLAAGK